MPNTTFDNNSGDRIGYRETRATKVENYSSFLNEGFHTDGVISN